MIRVTVEIVPFGIEHIKRHIGTLEIARTTERSNPETYNWQSYKADGEIEWIGQVVDHYYDAGAWDLIRRAVECLAVPDLRSRTLYELDLHAGEN